MATTVAPITLEEFSSLPRNGERHEMSNGVLWKMPPPKFIHTRIARLIFKMLEASLETTGE